MQRQISLTKMHDDKLTALANQLGLSRSETIRRLIDAWQPNRALVAEADRDRQIAR